MSEEVSQELIHDGLEAHKVNLKLKTVNFQVYTRTKTLNSHTNKTDDIYEGAKILFLNEWENSLGKLKIRLIGKLISILIVKNLKTEANNDS